MEVFFTHVSKQLKERQGRALCSVPIILKTYFTEVKKIKKQKTKICNKAMFQL